jgi:hypothetical protein
MKQYRITSADFITPGETLDPDAGMDPQDLANIKAMTGITGIMMAAIANPLPLAQPTQTLREQKYE